MQYGFRQTHELVERDSQRKASGLLDMQRRRHEIDCMATGVQRAVNVRRLFVIHS